MTADRIDKNGEAVSMSLAASVAGLALGSVLALAISLGARADFYAWLIYVGTPCFFGLEISALVVGLLEGRAKFRKGGLILSAAAILVGLGAVFKKLHVDFDGIYITLYVFFPWLVAPILAVLAGLWAIAVKKGRARGSMAMLILWLTPVGFVLAGLLLVHRGFPMTENITAAFAVLFGPWATLAAKIGAWPNAGEFFHLPLAISLTVALAAAATVVLKAKSKSVAGSSIIVFMALAFSWFAVGYGQLINCHE
jgi:hypothetical protein